MRATTLTRLLVLVTLMLILLPAVVQASQAAASSSAAALADITISFKLDPRALGPTYGGERWVSPATYDGSAAQDMVDAKAMGVGAKGEPVRISPKWIASDPEMVTVSPDQGEQVKIKVKHDGESKLQVSAEGISKELLIKVEHSPITKAIQVHITQPKTPPTAAPTTENAPATKRPEAVSASDSSTFKSQEEKVSYAIGMQLGNDLRKRSIAVDPAALSQGVKDALAGGETLLTAEGARAVLVDLRNQASQKQKVQGAYKTLAEKNKQAGEAFLTENKSKDGIVTLPSGLQYKVITAGEGPKPTLNDKVVCNYRGTFLDGMEFDSTDKRRAPVTFAIASAIPGWREALQLMPVGSKWQLFVPSELAYGARGTRTARLRKNKKGAVAKQKIGPNATLIFELELLSLEDSPAAGTQQAQQDQNAVQDESSAPSKEMNQ